MSGDHQVGKRHVIANVVVMSRKELVLAGVALARSVSYLLCFAENRPARTTVTSSPFIAVSPLDFPQWRLPVAYPW